MGSEYAITRLISTEHLTLYWLRYDNVDVDSKDRCILSTLGIWMCFQKKIQPWNMPLLFLYIMQVKIKWISFMVLDCIELLLSQVQESGRNKELS